ncbi:MAG: aminoglycoside phosphotransferase family protein [Ruminococcus sp.]|nr:aminoglycoside phosphotransferase family protein [Ruminococcus sp.]
MDFKSHPAAVCRLFGIVPDSSPEMLGTGHINSTYKLTSDGTAYILQSLNPAVFPRPETVMSNIAAVQKAFSHRDCADVAVPEFLSAGGRNYVIADGRLWRMYRFAEPGTADCFTAGLAFGTFMRVISDAELSPALEGYHDFQSYLLRLEAVSSGAENELCVTLAGIGRSLAECFPPSLPLRNIHGDAKLDNVITGKVSTVIDLDTVMKSYAALDYGDLIRSLCPAGTPDTNRIRAATAGFAEGLQGILSPGEVRSLYSGILRSACELAVRYLTDFLTGEGYFGRTRAQCHERAAALTEQLRSYMSTENVIIGIVREYFPYAFQEEQ